MISMSQNIYLETLDIYDRYAIINLSLLTNFKYYMGHHLKHRQICAHLGWKANEYKGKIYDMYINNMMSGQEIADYINQNTPAFLTITCRSIQRIVRNYSLQTYGVVKSRGIKESFNNAIKRGRVKWAYKELKFKRTRLNSKLRYKILKRDGFACVLCGNTAKTSMLQVDHIVRISEGGLSVEDNLRTLCHDCNFGRG